MGVDWGGSGLSLALLSKAIRGKGKAFLSWEVTHSLTDNNKDNASRVHAAFYIIKHFHTAPT